MIDTEHYERLSTGAAYAPPSEDNPVVRINPIAEGEITVGQSGEPTAWTREALMDAVEKKRLADPQTGSSDIVIGTGGKNPHWDFNEQVPPRDKLARVEVEDWTYEDGVGPVAHARIADEDIANRIQLGLLDVSADLSRELGKYNEELGAREVEEILAMPRVTVVDRGAAQNASIEPATAEALGYNPDGEDDRHLVEQLASEGDAVRWQSDSGGQREPDDVRYGVVVNPAPDDSGRDWMVAIYQANEDYDGWESRTTEPMSDDTLERVGSNGVDSLPPVSQVVGTEQNAPNPDEGADTPTGSGSQPKQPTTTMPEQDTDLHEQLAEVRQRANSLEDERDGLESKTNDLEEQLSEVESDLEEKEQTIEQLQPIKTVLAEAAAADSRLSAEQLADRFTADELIDTLGDDEDEEQSPVDVVREQLAGDIAPRGDATEDEPEDVDHEAVEQLAQSAMNITDLKNAHEEDLGKREYLQREYDVDPAEYGTSDSLRAAIKESGD